MIDGGFLKAYQKETGIAGYTLISNSHTMRIITHNIFRFERRNYWKWHELYILYNKQLKMHLEELE